MKEVGPMKFWKESLLTQCFLQRLRIAALQPSQLEGKSVATQSNLLSEVGSMPNSKQVVQGLSSWVLYTWERMETLQCIQAMSSIV